MIQEWLNSIFLWLRVAFIWFYSLVLKILAWSGDVTGMMTWMYIYPARWPCIFELFSGWWAISHSAKNFIYSVHIQIPWLNKSAKGFQRWAMEFVWTMEFVWRIEIWIMSLSQQISHFRRIIEIWVPCIEGIDEDRFPFCGKSWLLTRVHAASVLAWTHAVWC